MIEYSLEIRIPTGAMFILRNTKDPELAMRFLWEHVSAWDTRFYEPITVHIQQPEVPKGSSR